MLTEFKYWGTHSYDSETNTLHWVRSSGIFSNIMVIIHGLTDLWLKGIYPENIDTQLTHYNGFNLYDGVFEINKSNLGVWRQFDKDRIASMRNNTSPSIYGFGSSQNQIDLELCRVIIDTYFNYSPNLKSRINQLCSNHNSDSVFIWWRKTDKIHEIARSKHNAKYPDISDVVKHIITGKQVYVQTDDPTVYNEFSKMDVTCLDIFNRNKYFVNDQAFKSGFHVESNEITDNDFEARYSMSRKDYIIGLIALADIASKSTQYIGYPGNISLFVSLLRNNFNNVVFFKNKEELF